MELRNPFPRVVDWMEDRRRFRSVATALRRSGYSLRLALDRRLVLVLAVDALFVFFGVLEALVEGAGMARVLSGPVFMPALLLLLPTLAGSVELERRAGSLDLALASVDTERYFLRRLLSVVGLFMIQGAILVGLAYIEESGAELFGWNRHTLPFIRTEIQVFMLHAFLAANILFWCTRLRTAGAVWVASLITAGLFSGRLRVPSAWQTGYNEFFFGISLHLFTWIWSMVVVGLATAIFYLYARERLRRPETMLD